MDNKNNLVSQVNIEYLDCFSNILARHRNNHSLPVEALIRLIYAEKSRGIGIRIFVKSLWNIDGWSCCYSIP